jgi:hypothetical protein
VTNNSGLLLDELSGSEYGEVWDAAYRKPCCELLVLIGVDFEDEGLTRHVFCGARDLRGGCATGAAPVSPEVDQDRNARVLDDFVEERSVDLHGLIERWQRGFACAATAGVRKVVRSDAVFLTTALAYSYRRHSFTPFDWIHLAGFGCVASVAQINWFVGVMLRTLIERCSIGRKPPPGARAPATVIHFIASMQ